jgi:hypothetical protein
MAAWVARSCETAGDFVEPIPCRSRQLYGERESEFSAMIEVENLKIAVKLYEEHPIPALVLRLVNSKNSRTLWLMPLNLNLNCQSRPIGMAMNSSTELKLRIPTKQM